MLPSLLERLQRAISRRNRILRDLPRAKPECVETMQGLLESAERRVNRLHREYLRKPETIEHVVDGHTYIIRFRPDTDQMDVLLVMDRWVSDERLNFDAAAFCAMGYVAECGGK